MATKAKSTSALDKLKALREQVNGLDLDDAMKARILDEAREQFSGASSESLFADLRKLAGHEKHAGAREFLAGQKATFSVIYPEDPEAELIIKETVRKYTPRKASTGGGARGKQTVVTDKDGNETTYDSASAACDALDFDHEGKSAVRVLERAVKNGQIKSVAFPESEADDSESE